MDENLISYEVIGIALTLHRQVGPGLLESAYEAAMAHELTKKGFHVRQQIPMPIVYDGQEMGIGYRIDIVVNDLVIIEVKSVETLLPVHYSQLLTYLRLSGKKLGLLINFNSEKLKDGIHRIVNQL